MRGVLLRGGWKRLRERECACPSVKVSRDGEPVDRAGERLTEWRGRGDLGVGNRSGELALSASMAAVYRCASARDLVSICDGRGLAA